MTYDDVNAERTSAKIKQLTGERIEKLMKQVTVLEKDRDELEALCDKLGEALASFDALIKYQYTGSKEAMSALQIAAWEATQPLAAWREMKGQP